MQMFQVVARRSLRPPRKQRPRLSHRRALQQSFLKIFECVGYLLPCRRHGWNPPIRWIHDERRAPGRLYVVPPWSPDGVIRAGHILFTSYPPRTAIATLSGVRVPEPFGHLLAPKFAVLCLHFRIRQELSPGILSGSLQRRIFVAVPYSLEVGLTPGGTNDR